MVVKLPRLFGFALDQIRAPVCMTKRSQDIDVTKIFDQIEWFVNLVWVTSNILDCITVNV